MTFGQKIPKLNSRLVYCSWVYGTSNISPAASGKGTGISPTDDPRYWCRISWGSTGAADEVEIEKLWTAKGSDGPRKKLKKLDFHQFYEVIYVSLSDVFLMGNFSVVSSFYPMALYVLIWLSCFDLEKGKTISKSGAPSLRNGSVFWARVFIFNWFLASKKPPSSKLNQGHRTLEKSSGRFLEQSLE